MTGLGGRDATELLHASTADLVRAAGRLRDEHHGSRITFSPKVFIPLTMLCRDRCGYCTFAKAPAHLEHPFLPLDEVLAIARAGAALGCHEALFTLGEAPEDRYPVAADWLDAHGHASTVDYLVEAAAAVLEETGLLPHANAGALSEADLIRLRAVSPSQGMMIESLADRLHERGGAHHRAPDKTAARRLATLEAAGVARVPFTTGILVGIGETEAERLDALLAIRESHARHGHVQEVIVQNFLPKPGTGMHAEAPCDPEDFVRAIAIARLVLGGEMHLQAPPNLTDLDGLHDLVAAGIDDWGGVSPVTARSREPRTPVARARGASQRHRGGRQGPRAAPHRVPGVRAGPGRVAAPRRSLRGALCAGPRRARARRRLGEWRQRRSPAPPATIGAGPGRWCGRRSARRRSARVRRWASTRSSRS